MRTVLIVLFDGVQSLDVTGPLEALAGARTEAGGPGYEVRTASLDGGPVRSSSGLRLTPDGPLRGLPDAQRPDILLVNAGSPATAPAHIVAAQRAESRFAETFAANSE